MLLLRLNTQLVISTLWSLPTECFLAMFSGSACQRREEEALEGNAQMHSTCMMQTGLSSIKLQLEAEHQTLAALQDELSSAQQQQTSLQHTLQQEQNHAEEETRKVHLPSVLYHLLNLESAMLVDVYNCSQWSLVPSCAHLDTSSWVYLQLTGNTL